MWIKKTIPLSLNDYVLAYGTTKKSETYSLYLSRGGSPLWCISKLKPSPIIIPINIIIHLRNFLTIGPVDTQVYE